MADEAQLSLLKQGVKEWNEWRREHQQVQADLSRADLSRTNLNRAELQTANLREADLFGAYLMKATLSGANLSKANLRETNLIGAELTEANLIGADLMDAHLRDAHLIRANLSEARLMGAQLIVADLSGANLSKADLLGAELNEANLSKADLSGAFLIETIFSKAILYGANFERAIVGSTIFGGVNLSSCKGLDSVLHRGPSTLGVDSIILSKGRIPHAFLRGVGLPDEWITYIPSLVGEGIQFFSCFISYSSFDKPFALRLHEALQSKGIRCWLDEKHLLPGDDISRELERGISSWDKFILCASKNSLTSTWVEEEITTTLEKERRLRNERGEKVLKLIPLNLDGYMFSEQWDLGIHAREIRSRVAADFRDWENSSSNFDKQVDRVIKALRADEGARENPPPSRL